MDEQKMATETNSDEIEINLVEVVATLLDKMKWIVLSGVLCALLAGGYVFVTENVGTSEPTYAAKTTVYYGYTYFELTKDVGHTMEAYLAADLQALATSQTVVNSAMEALALDMTYGEFKSALTVEWTSGQHFLYVTVKNQDSALALEMSNALSAALSEYVAQELDVVAPSVLHEEEQVSVVSSTKDVVLWVLGGLFVGAFLAVGVILFWPIVASFAKDVTTYRKESKQK